MFNDSVFLLHSVPTFFKISAFYNCDMFKVGDYDYDYDYEGMVRVRQNKKHMVKAAIMIFSY